VWRERKKPMDFLSYRKKGGKKKWKIHRREKNRLSVVVKGERRAIFSFQFLPRRET